MHVKFSNKGGLLKFFKFKQLSIFLFLFISLFLLGTDLLKAEEIKEAKSETTSIIIIDGNEDSFYSTTMMGSVSERRNLGDWRKRASLSSRGGMIVNTAKRFIGVPYVWGGTTTSGFDCSGLVQYVYRHFGINISRTTKTQINDGREVGRNELQLGDLVFPSNGHVTLYVGNGQVLHAPQPGDRVKISPIWAFWRARRILSDDSNRHFRDIGDRLPKIPSGEFTLHARSCLHRTSDIKKNGSGTKKTEVHILNGANNYQNFRLFLSFD